MFFPSNIDFFSVHLAGGGWSSTSNGWSFIARGGCFAPDFFKATKWRSNLLVAVERLAISFLNVRLASNVQQAFSIHALVLLVLHEVESCRTLWRSNQPTLFFFCEGEAVVTEVDCELLWPSICHIPLLFDVWIAGAAEYCHRLSKFLRGHRKLEDFLPSHRSCCAVLSQVLIFPGKFSKLLIGVQQTLGGQKGRKEDSLQYEGYSYVTVILKLETCPWCKRLEDACSLILFFDLFQASPCLGWYG